MAEKKEIDSAKFDLAFEKVKDALKVEFGLQDKPTLFADGLKELKLPEYVMDVVNEEKAKLFGLKPGNEFNKIKNYLDWLTSLPWAKTTEDKKDLEWAEYILEKDLHGIKNVKKKILELIWVGMLEQQQRNGKILCLDGLPGVGKKSLAKSIAKAIGRKFCHFSMAEMADPSDLKGQRRFDPDAMPGKLIQCLKEAQCANPLILIEDIDKISGLHMEAMISALHQIMDQKQNSKFFDHFIEIPFDCSKIIFVCTANGYYTIPGHWQRQMEIIELDGYTAEEKLEIAKKYLIPKCQKIYDIMEDKLLVKDDALQMLLREYCPELGLKEMEEYIGKIWQKAAYKFATTGQQQIIVSNENLMDLLDEPPLYCNDRLHEKNTVGVIMGLAILEPIGGYLQYVEVKLRSSCRAPGERSLIMTGNLSEIMKESIEIAFTVAKDFLSKIGAKNAYDLLDKAAVQVHLPHVSLPKDGSSSGAAIASAIVSRALNQPAKEGFAMTGTITLTGKILPIGSVKQKVIAAKRSGATKLILPEWNKAHFLKLESFIKEGIKVYYVTEFWQIFQLLFPDWNAPANGPSQSPPPPPSSSDLAKGGEEEGQKYGTDLAKSDGGKEDQKDGTDLAKVGGEEGQKDGIDLAKCDGGKEDQKDGTDLAKVGGEEGQKDGIDLAKCDGGEEGQTDGTNLAKVGGEKDGQKDDHEKQFSTINKDEAITTEQKELSADMNLPAGEVIPTAGGGTAVQFMDVENLEQETPYDE